MRVGIGRAGTEHGRRGKVTVFSGCGDSVGVCAGAFEGVLGHGELVCILAIPRTSN